MSLDGQGRRLDGGYAMAALLVGLAVASILMSVALPAWRHLVQREKEEELIFRGQQYVRAIGLFQRKYGATFPPSLDVLVEQRFIRRKFKDPMTADGEFEVLYADSLVATLPGQRAGGGRSGGGTTPGLTGQGAGSATPGAGGQPGGGGTSSRPSGSSGRTGSSLPGFSLGSGNRATPSARGGVVGVASKNTSESVKLYNGRNHYNEWQFVFTQMMMQPGVGAGGGVMGPGGLGRGGRGGDQGTPAAPGMRGRGRFGQEGQEPGFGRRGDAPGMRQMGPGGSGAFTPRRPPGD